MPLFLLLLLSFPLHANILVDKKNEITEQFKFTNNGFIFTRKSISQKHTNNIIFHVGTNVNQATTGFTNFSNQKTNEFFIIRNGLLTPTEKIDIGYSEVILFPEIQLKSFLLTSFLSNITFFTIDPLTLKVFKVIAKKNVENSQIHVSVYDTKKPKKAILIYSFDTNGILLRKKTKRPKSKQEILIPKK